jgi:phosphohistidine phosphatase
MELILWRHADAEDAFPDESRQLTDKGRRQAKRMADWLNERLPGDCLILSSPAIRAWQTAEALGRTVKTEPALSTASTAPALLRAVGWPDGDGTTVVVGHQPTLGAAAALALTGKAAAWPVKKGAFWWIVSAADGLQVRAVLTPKLT